MPNVPTSEYLDHLEHLGHLGHGESATFRCWPFESAGILPDRATHDATEDGRLDRIQLKAEPRTVLGKKVRALRQQGVVPANVYGHADSEAVQVPVKESEHVLARAGKTQLISLELDGSDATTVLVKDFQRHPIKGSLLHIDFYRVAMTERMRVDVPLQFVGEAPAVKTHNATLLTAASTVSVESLPADFPETIEVDVSGLSELDSAVYVRDLRTPSGVLILTDPDELLVKVLPPRVEVEVEEEAAAEGEPTAEAAASEEGAEAATEETSE
jgi:large subunit ribosomal protein L25